MTAIEMAERKGRGRAAALRVFSGVIALDLWFSFGPTEADFFRGLWLGMTLAAVLSLTPIARWLKPNSTVAQLMDDESVREHRRISCMAGFWAAVAVALVLTVVDEATPALSAFDTARVIATAAVVTAFVSFAALELRASRG